MDILFIVDNWKHFLCYSVLSHKVQGAIKKDRSIVRISLHLNSRNVGWNITDKYLHDKVNLLRKANNCTTRLKALFLEHLFANNPRGDNINSNLLPIDKQYYFKYGSVEQEKGPKEEDSGWRGKEMRGEKRGFPANRVWRAWRFWRGFTESSGGGKWR